MNDPLWMYKLKNGLLGTPESYDGALSHEVGQRSQNDGLMNFGAALLAAGGPSRTPTSLGQALGPAILQGRQAQQQGQSDSFKALMLKQQLAAQKKTHELNEKKLQREINAPISLSRGERLVKPDGTPIVENPFVGSAADDPSSVREWQFYNNLSDTDKQRFLEMKRAQQTYMTNLGGVPTIATAPTSLSGPKTAPLSTLANEAVGKETLADAEATGKVTGTVQAEKSAALPSTIEALNKMQTNIQSLLDDPGFDTIYGMSSALSPSMYMRGTDAANADAKRNQLEGQTFLASIQSMRGFGQLSNNEGLKVTQAYTRATNPKISEKEARKAWGEVIDGVERLKKVAAQEAGQGQGGKESAADRAKRLGL